MITNLRESIAARRAKNLFPKAKKKYWYCYEFHDYQYKLMKAKKPWKSSEITLPCEVFVFNPWYTNGRLPEVGDIIPCIQLDGWVGLYEVTKKYKYESAKSMWADLASWDDGYNIDLELHHCGKANQEKE